MKLIPCNSCGSDSFVSLFEKKSSLDETFQIVKCGRCGLVQVNPQPEPGEVAKYYSNEYFTRRTDRGYDNYYSETVRSEIARVFRLNLNDLGFDKWSASLPPNRSSMDIGCAAGYFVDFMKQSGWDASGIEIADGPAGFAVKSLGLNVIKNDFLLWDTKIKNRFNLVTLWASIEHLHQPRETLNKAYRHLQPGGMMIVSTCRYGLLARLMGKNWRYMNVPEHLYYYTLEGLVGAGIAAGFKKYSHITYGSGMTSRKNASVMFRTAKKLMDWLVKATDQGDMMAVAFVKE